LVYSTILSTEIFTPPGLADQNSSSAIVKSGNLPFGLENASIVYFSGFVFLFGGRKFQTLDLNGDILVFKVKRKRWNVIEKCLDLKPTYVSQDWIFSFQPAPSKYWKSLINLLCRYRSIGYGSANCYLFYPLTFDLFKIFFQ
jgi:hypothetical protein